MRKKLTDLIRKYRTPISYGLIIVAAYLLLFALGITCPIKHIVGISCPGCGMSRAWFHALTFRFSEAIGYHPLFWIVPVVAIAWLFRNQHPRIWNCILWGAVGLMLAAYVLRLIDTTDAVVVFDPQNGAILRMVRWILQ